MSPIEPPLQERCLFSLSLSQMAKPGSSLPANMAGESPGSDDFWRENVRGGWATALVLVFLLLWQISRAFSRRRVPASGVLEPVRSPGGDSSHGISEIIADADLRNLISNLDGKLNDKERWEDVIDKRNGLLSYNAKCCRPKVGPLKYLSVTTFEKCSPEMLRDFYMDNQYRKEWDKTVVEHEQLEVDERSGTEIGRTIKKFPLLTPREYILAWRVWQGKDKTFYCFVKDCEHPLASRKKKYVRVGFFRSGWRIRKVPGRDACEIKLVHQEDAGLNIEMAKLAFSKGIWSYVCKMNDALREYSSRRCVPMTSPATAQRLIQVPPGLERVSETTHCSSSETTSGSITENAEDNLSKNSSKKWITKGLLVLGGIVCLSRGHSTLGAQLAMACILKKLMKHGGASNQAELPRGTTRGRRPPLRHHH